MKILVIGTLETFAGGTMSLINLCISLKEYENISVQVFGLANDDSLGFNRINKELKAHKIALIKEPVFYWHQSKIGILRKASRLVSLLLNVYHLIKYVKNNNIDIIHTYDSYVNLIGTIAAKLTGAKIVYTAHLETDIGPQYNIWRPRLILKMADVIITTCKDYIRAGILNGLDSRKIINIYTGVREFESYQEENSLSLTEYELADNKDKTTMALIGRMDEQKGHEIVIEAVRSSPEFFSKALILFVGDTGVNPQYVERLKTKIEKYGINDIIKIAGTASSIKKLLKVIDIVLLPSRYESVPMILLEAVQAGKPIVASKVGGIPEIIIDGVNGYTFDINDPHSLTLKIKKIVNNPSKVDTFIKAGQLMLNNQFSLKRMAQNHSQVYRSLLKK
jgi:glycosyltransferase involved in cell wall biosynthesis